MKRWLFLLLLMKPWALLQADDDIALFMPVPASGAEAALETRGKFLDHLNKFLEWLSSFTQLTYSTSQKLGTFIKPPECLVRFEADHGFFSTVKPLIGLYTSPKEDVKIVEAVLERIDQEVQEPAERLFYIQEILSKALAYRHLAEGDEIILPDFDKPRDGATYRVEKIFDLGMSMPAFGLTCKLPRKPSLLLFRGTDLRLTHGGAIASIVADLDLFGPGYTAFFNSKGQLEAFCLGQKLNGKNCIVLGFSLGGILSTYTAMFLPDYIDISRSVAFSPPGVQKKLLKLCKKSKKLEHFRVYINQHDPVSKWGFLVGNVQVLSVEERMGPVKAHTLLMGSQVNLNFYQCDLDEENQRHRYLFAPE